MEKRLKVQADFNGLFGEVLCLSHNDTCLDEHGNAVALEEGMQVLAFEVDLDKSGQPDNLIASGVVIRPPEWLSCLGSRWALKIDANGVRHESDLR